MTNICKQMLLLLLLMMGVSSQDAAGWCNAPWIQIESECFRIYSDDSDLTSWQQAQDNCQREGGDLAQPNNLQTLRTYLQKNSIAKDYWLGGLKSGGRWQWLSGRLITDPWMARQPSGFGDCLDFDSSQNPSLHDYVCEGTQRYICDKKDHIHSLVKTQQCGNAGCGGCSSQGCVQPPKSVSGQYWWQGNNSPFTQGGCGGGGGGCGGAPVNLCGGGGGCGSQQQFPQSHPLPQQQFQRNNIRPQQQFQRNNIRPQQQFPRNNPRPQQQFQQNNPRPQQQFQQNNPRPQQQFTQTSP